MDGARVRQESPVPVGRRPSRPARGPALFGSFAAFDLTAERLQTGDRMAFRNEGKSGGSLPATEHEGPRWRLAVAMLASVLAVAVTPGVARACGGFFCDRPAAANPVPVIAQAAENVVFALDRDPQTGAGTVEAHIQIKYAGAADQFSWIVPVTSMPTLGVGSDVLFQVLEPKTRPTFTTQFIVDGSCMNPNGGSSQGFGCGGSSSATAGDSKGAADAGVRTGPAVDVTFQGNIGPYESVVVRSDDATALETWLDAHGYFVSPEASQIIQQYVATQSYFVALRLQANRTVDEIQPIVLKLLAEEGCLPLKLTAVAATPDVRINVWVLGASRAVPINYDELTLNLAKLDWFGNGANYDRLVSDAANEAGGNAFLAEYAQPTAAAASWFDIPATAATTLATVGTTPAAFVGALLNLGLTLGGRVLEVLRAQIPEPSTTKAAGITEAQFYNPQNGFLFNTGQQFDAAAAAAQMETDVFAPMRGLKALFAAHPYLTRLATFISADEMTKDPLFVTNRTLPAVSNVHTAVAHVLCGNEDFTACSAPVRLDITEGGSLRYRSSGSGSCSPSSQAFQRGNLDTDLPAAQQVWRRDADGAGTLLQDATEQIAATLHRHDMTVPSSDNSACAVGRRTRLSATGVLLIGAALALARARRRRRP